MRTDLTEIQIRDLLRRSDRIAKPVTFPIPVEYWTNYDAQLLRSVVGELQRLRDSQASVMHLHEIEGAY